MLPQTKPLIDNAVSVDLEKVGNADILRITHYTDITHDSMKRSVDLSLGLLNTPGVNNLVLLVDLSRLSKIPRDAIGVNTEARKLTQHPKVMFAPIVVIFTGSRFFASLIEILGRTASGKNLKIVSTEEAAQQHIQALALK